MVSDNWLGFILSIPFLLTTYYPPTDDALGHTTQLKRTIPQGTLLGKTLRTRHGRSINSFLGIPYAQPPIGNLRFANPIPASRWNGILNATVEQSMCPQISITSNELIGDEDCLYLEVHTPEDACSSLLPVMVYIHGGGFQGEFPGSSGPEYLLDADVVLVNLRYRLGPLGFLSTGDEVASGNWGLKDQVLALKWVQNNIRHFGGNPDQVTVFGESAGASAVHLLALSNSTIGLFHKCITQSGSALAFFAYRPRHTYFRSAFELGEYVGCYNDTSKSLISCLRTRDFSEIINTTTNFYLWQTFPKIVWGPTDELDIEGAFITDSPSNLIAAGKIRDVPWITGVVRDEGLLYSASLYKDEEMLSDFLENIDTAIPVLLFWIFGPESGTHWVKAAKSYYFPTYQTADRSEIFRNLTMLIGDVYFYYPFHAELRQQHALAVNPQYIYSFNYPGTYSFTYTFGGGTTDYGVCHADDLIYLFPKQSDFAALNESMSDKDYEMVDAMVQLWTSFAINGKPTALALGDTTWESYSATLDNHLRIGSGSDVAFDVQYFSYQRRMQFWDEVYNSLTSNFV